jgi:uncharacterized protein YndB with AHSA1/START domain
VNVSRSVHVPRPPERAFRLFTDGIGAWWPRATHSYGGDRAGAVVLEAELGGLYERFVDGDEIEIGRVTSCDPPHRIAFSWQAPGWEEATEVEVRFSPQPGGGTRLDLEHRGFERIGPGSGPVSEGFGGGWATVLGAYAAHVAGTAPP